LNQYPPAAAKASSEAEAEEADDEVEEDYEDDIDDVSVDLGDDVELSDTMAASGPAKINTGKTVAAPEATSHIQKVVMPYTVLQLKDTDGRSFVRLEIHLLSGMTSESIHTTVDKGGRSLLLKYYLPEVSVNPNRLDSITNQDGDWLLSTNLATAATESARAVLSAFNNEPIHCVQRIKLPFVCKRRLSREYGKGSFVKMIEHDDPDFAEHSQMYYYLVINLEALDEPEEVAHSGPAFVLMKNPGSGRAKSNPFASAMAVEPAPATSS
jgi:hypothetical protein